MVGPTFLRYPIALGKSVTLNAVERLDRSVQAQLKLDAPPRVGLEGRRVVIDVQRADRQLVRFSEIRSQLPAREPLIGCAQVPLGVDIAGRLHMADFREPENAHLLVAGTTGSGKTEWLRSAVAGLLATSTPETLRLVLIDPKRNAFQMLQNSPFLYRPLVYPEDESVTAVLGILVEEMEARYRKMSESGSDCLIDHIRRRGVPVARIFCICDEFANLLQGDRESRRALEEQVHRLGQKARAAGIHLILATQQPSREIIRGPLASNIPARVGLKMTSAIESRMLLGTGGAETLLGRGDLLFKCIGDPIRLQSACVLSDELAELASTLRS
jgi:DNA segregation ATPase FtsK/SpoIIIE-like protein